MLDLVTVGRQLWNLTQVPHRDVFYPLFLFILYTNSFCATQPGCHIVKYADDTVVLGKISKNNEDSYRKETYHVISWCQDNFLVLNVSKTKEMVIDFRQQATCRYPVFVNSEAVEIVDRYVLDFLIIQPRNHY